MKRCLELAARGAAWVSPNPMVGCLIVKNGRVVGEGYHHRFGLSHAEVNALRAAGRSAKGATLVVNLEPCVHFGKTPPCADSIIAAGVREVVIAARDPNPLVQGKGIERLRNAGIRVQLGVLRTEAQRLNERFFHFMQTGLPFVGIKLAQTLDGRIADANGRSKWITSAAARTEAHRLRATYDAVMVGAETALRDDPALTVRLARGRNPIRVVVDGRLRVHGRLKVFETDAAETILLTSAKAMKSRRRLVEALTRRGVRVLAAGDGANLRPADVLRELAACEISSVLVEGGSTTASMFLESRLADRVHLFVAPALLGAGLTGLSFATKGMKSLIRLNGMTVRRIGADVLLTGIVR